MHSRIPVFSHPVIKEEATESRAEVKAFDHGKLKHVETQEKNPLPTPADLKEEMRPENLADVSEVTKFDSSKLKRVDTIEKNVLPTADGQYRYINYIIQINTLFSKHSARKLMCIFSRLLIANMTIAAAY